MTPRSDEPSASAPSSAFERAMVDRGTDLAVAREIERRINIVEGEESDDASRAPYSQREIITYVLVTVGIVVLGALVVIL